MSEQAKFDYSSLGNIFTEGLDKDDQKEGLFKKLEYIKDKSEEQLNAFSTTNKAKNESNFNYDYKYSFYKFHRNFKKFKTISLGSKYDEMNDFYTLLNVFINTQKATTTETNDRKNRIFSNVKQLYNKYLDTYKKKYASEKIKN